MDISGLNLPFLCHVLVEIPASISFMLHPSQQLITDTPHAHAMIRQYALLLFSSVLIAATFVRRPLDNTAACVAGALALYHVGPTLRSFSRLRGSYPDSKSLIRSEAFCYLMVHVICGSLLGQLCWQILRTELVKA